MPFDFDPVIRNRNLTPKKSEVAQPQGTIDPFGETVIDPYAIHAEEIDFRTPNNAQPAAVLTKTHSDPVAIVQEPEPKTDSSPVQKEIVTEPTVVITKEITPVIKKSTNKHHLKDATDLEDSIKIYDEITRKLYEKEAAETSKTSTLELPVGRVETVKKGYEVKITHNRTLSKLIFEWRKKQSLPAEIYVRGLTIATTRMPGLWDEGGAHNGSGCVITAADPDGCRITPVVTNRRLEFVNGRHALLPIWEGCFIIFGWQRNGRDVIAVYRVAEVICNEDTAKVPYYRGELQGYLTRRKWKQIAEVAVDRPKWSAGSAAIVAADEQLFKVHSVVPAYCGDYAEHYFPIQDYQEWSIDPTVLADYVEETSIRKIYAKIDKAFAPYTPTLAASERELILLIFSIDPKDQQLYAYIFAGIYDVNLQSSRGRRFVYTCLKFNDDTVFFYPDRDDVPQNRIDPKLIKNAIQQAGGLQAMAFRRMTNSQYYRYTWNEEKIDIVDTDTSATPDVEPSVSEPKESNLTVTSI